MARATEDQFNELHRIVTEEIASRIKQGTECSTADLRVAIDWLAKNNITGIPISGSPLAALLESIEMDLEDVERVIK